MTLDVNPVEAVWIALNLSTFVLTTMALLGALADRRAVKALNGAANELSANSIVRREIIRLIIQGLLLAIVIPGLFSDRPTPLSFGVVVIMAVALLLLLSTSLDARDRRQMTIIVAADLLAIQQSDLLRIEGKLDVNTKITQETSEETHQIHDELKPQ